MKNQYSMLILCSAFVILWSSGFVGAKYGLEYAGTYTLLTWRYFIVVVVLALLVTIYRSWCKISLKAITRHATVGILAHAVWLVTVLGAIDLGVSAGLAAFITALQPMVTAVFSPAITHEKVMSRQWVGLLLGLVAVFMVVGDKVALGGSIIAYSLPFVAVVAISAATLIERRSQLTVQTQTPILLVIFIHCSASLIVLAPMAAIFEGFESTWGGGLAFSVLWLALVVSLAAYGLMFFLLRKMEATKVSSLTYLGPPTTMIIAYFVFSESLTAIDIAALALASLAVWMVTTQKKTPVKKHVSRIDAPEVCS